MDLTLGAVNLSKICKICKICTRAKSEIYLPSPSTRKIVSL